MQGLVENVLKNVHKEKHTETGGTSKEVTQKQIWKTDANNPTPQIVLARYTKIHGQNSEKKEGKETDSDLNRAQLPYLTGEFMEVITLSKH